MNGHSMGKKISFKFVIVTIDEIEIDPLKVFLEDVFNC